MPNPDPEPSPSPEKKKLLPENQNVTDYLKAIGKNEPKSGQKQIEDDWELVANLIRDLTKEKVSLPTDPILQLEKLIEIIQQRVSAQINEVLHDPDFQSLEAAWVGLEQLTVNCGLQKNRMELRVMDISKQELAEHIELYPGREIRTGELYTALYGDNIGRYGGMPLSCVAADMYFGPGNTSVEYEEISGEVSSDCKTLQAMAMIASDCNAPFLSSVTPRLFGPKYKSWAEVQSQPDDLSIYNNFLRAEYLAPWRSMRDTLDSSFLGFTTHRILAREPYLKAKNLDFKEVTDGKEKNYVWVNGVIGLLENIAAACFKWDWPMQWRGEEGGGVLPRLPQHKLGPGHVIGPLDAQITNSREAVFSKLGFMPLLQHKVRPDALFRGGQSSYEAPEFTGKDGIVATENAQLQSCLPYLFLACRISHYATLKAWAKVGDLTSPAMLQNELEDWLNTDVIFNAVTPMTPKQALYKRPVFSVKVIVSKIPGKKGYYDIQFKITPHEQFEGANMDFSLSSEVHKTG